MTLKPTSSQGSGGGGSAPVNSWLVSSFASSVDLSIAGSQTCVLDFPADGSHGSDISLSANGETFTLATTGLYAIYLLHRIDADATAAATSARVEVKITGTFAGNNIFGALASEVVGLNASECSPFVVVATTVPPAYYTAGDSFSVVAQGFNYTAGAFTYSAADVAVTRVV